MSHGNVAVAVGTCETCGREGVELHPARHYDHRWGRRKMNCVDEFACHARWLEVKRVTGPR